MVIVTGQIGAGKSAFSAELAALGALVFSADAAVHDLYERDEELVAAVAALVGKDLRDSEGRLQREELAQAIFDSAELRAQVEALVHPAVGRALDRFRAEHSSELVVYDVPLWPAGADRRGAELVVEVTAPEELRRSRLAARGMAAADADRRMKAQAAAPRGSVDLVVENAGSLGQLAERAREVMQLVRGGRA